jgi:hypothetical protein
MELSLKVRRRNRNVLGHLYQNTHPYGQRISSIRILVLLYRLYSDTNDRASQKVVDIEDLFH